MIGRAGRGWEDMIIGEMTLRGVRRRPSEVPIEGIVWYHGVPRNIDQVASLAERGSIRISKVTCLVLVVGCQRRI